MKRILLIELKKSFRDLFFLAALAIGTLICVIGAVQVIRVFYGDMGVMGQIRRLEESGIKKEFYAGAQTLYNSWIGANLFSLGTTLFFAVTPILAALPVGWRFSEEIHSGYLHIIAPKCGRLRYFSAKLISSFAAGGAAVALPQLFSVLLVALFIPAIRPDILYAQYFSVTHGSVLSTMYYTHPLAAVAGAIGISFVFGGLFAWLSLAIAFLTPSRTATLVLPFLLLTAAGTSQSFLYYIADFSIAPLDMLHPFSSINLVTWPGICAWAGILLAITAPVILIKGCRREIA